MVYGCRVGEHARKGSCIGCNSLRQGLGKRRHSFGGVGTKGYVCRVPMIPQHSCLFLLPLPLAAILRLPSYTPPPQL